MSKLPAASVSTRPHTAWQEIVGSGGTNAYGAPRDRQNATRIPTGNAAVSVYHYARSEANL